MSDVGDSVRPLRVGPVRLVGPVNLVLSVLVVLALAAVLVLRFAGSAVLPGTTPAERAVANYAAVRDAAQHEVAAFLEIDYRHMDPLVQKVLDGATGAFRAQYKANQVNLTAAAQAARAVSSGTVKEIGINKISGQNATVYVAADAVVTNRSTGKVKGTRSCPHDGSVCRYYRLKLTMQQVGGTWKMAGLDFVS